MFVEIRFHKSLQLNKKPNFMSQTNNLGLKIDADATCDYSLYPYSIMRLLILGIQIRICAVIIRYLPIM
jgi:hypothetical protein